MMMTDWSGAQP